LNIAFPHQYTHPSSASNNSIVHSCKRTLCNTVKSRTIYKRDILEPRKVELTFSMCKFQSFYGRCGHELGSSGLYVKALRSAAPLRTHNVHLSMWMGNVEPAQKSQRKPRRLQRRQSQRRQSQRRQNQRRSAAAWCNDFVMRLGK
jgi:hypothetical protein